MFQLIKRFILKKTTKRNESYTFFNNHCYSFNGSTKSILQSISFIYTLYQIPIFSICSKSFVTKYCNFLINSKFRRAKNKMN